MTRSRWALGLLCAAWLAQTACVYGAGEPSDFELQVAHCLGIYTAMGTDIDQAAVQDCAADASPTVKGMCKSERENSPVVRRTEGRLRDYLLAKRVNVSDLPISIAMKRGALDYALTMGADRACVRGLVRQSAGQCADAPDDAVERLNKCPSIIKALPF